jgi:hypothetical protein
MELDISDIEREYIKPFLNVAGKCYLLTNDYWSWRKEYKAFREGKSRLMNSVSLLVRLDNPQEREALKVIKNLIIEYERELITMRGCLLSQSQQRDLTKDLKLHIDAHLWWLVGNNLWSSTCPRYNADDVV